MDSFQSPRLRVFALLLTCAACVISAPASSQLGAIVGVIGGGVLVDKAGDELEAAINQAKAAAEGLLGLADDIAKRRLDQINQMLGETAGKLIGKSKEAALEIIREATEQVTSLEQQIFSDLKAAIWEAECAGKRLVLEDAREALGGLADFLNLHQIKLTPPKRVRATPEWYSGCLLKCRDPYIVEIMSPFGETYIRVRDLMEESIGPEEVSEETPAYDIVGTYEFLSAFALKTSCFYPGSSDAWNREYVEYRAKARAWRNVLDVRPE